WPEVDGCRAITVEGGVGRPVRVQARDGHHLAYTRVARHDDLAVRLHQHGARFAVNRQHQAAVAVEVRVERAVRPQPGDHGAAAHRPATPMRPSAWRAAAKPDSVPPKSPPALPPVPNAVSSAPFAFRRPTSMSPPSGPEKPATTSLPSGRTSTAWARLKSCGLQLKVFLPSPEHVVSSEPLGLRRATAARRSEPPASTILPSGCSAAPKTDSPRPWPPRPITRLPPDPNVVSSTPLLRRRATQKRLGAVGSLAVLPATTILPLGCTSTAVGASIPPKLIVFSRRRKSSYQDHR